MSTSYYCYLGPTIVCQNAAFIEEQEQREVRRCRTANCGNADSEYIGYPFCPLCGQKPVKKLQKIDSKRHTTLQDILKATDLDEDRYLNANEGIDYDLRLIPNRVNIRKLGVSERGKEYDVGAIDTVKELRQFEERYEKDIAILRKFYEKVEVKFLLLNYRF